MKNMKFLSAAVVLMLCLSLQVEAQWLTSGANIYYNAGNVGIGTTTPSAKLDVSGNLTLGDRSTDPVISFIPSDNSPRPSLKHTLGTGFLYNVKSGEGHYFQDGGSATNMFIGGNGNVGIGTLSPAAKLEVAGAGLITGGLQVYNNSVVNSLIIGASNGLSSRLWISADGEGDAFMYFRTSGGTYWTYGTDQSSSNNLNWATGIDVGHSVKMTLDRSGNLGIGTTAPDSKLTVKGIIHAEEVKIDLSVPGPDYVFDENYPLLSLEETKAFIDKNHHLPGIPSSAEMQQNGVNLLEMNMKLLEKVEELTLHRIRLTEKIEEQSRRIRQLELR